MAKIDWQGAAIDGTLAIGGGSIVANKLLPMVPMVGDLLGKLPADIFGISVPIWIAGILVLALVKPMMK